VGNGVLVAGIGNIFQSDDGFGSEVARLLLAGPPPPEGVKIVDYGIRGVHLVYVIEPDVEAIESETGLAEAGIVDAHGMDPASVLALLRSLGGSIGRLLVVGCEPADVDDGIGLSDPVAGAVEEACRVVRQLIDQEMSRLQSSRKETLA
jgi:hydrogenase maturation protease